MSQGEIGNCWFISAASALAEKKGRMESVFLNNEVSANGIYGVNFYTLGVPHTVIVDDYLPLLKEGDGNTTNGAKVGTDGSLWPTILEKAFAKYHGNYSHMVGGDPQMAVKTLYGAPAKFFDNSKNTADQIWKEIKAAKERGDVVLTGTHAQGSRKNGENLWNGLSIMHAYTVLGPQVLTDEAGNEIKLIKMRNPWGAEDYDGAYSDKSSLWTDALRNQAGSVIANDGEFFIPLADYKKSFVETQINYNTEAMSRSVFLVLDDASTETRQGEMCQGTCSYHKFTIKSKETQGVHMRVSTW